MLRNKGGIYIKAKTEFFYPALPNQFKYNISRPEGQKNLFTFRCIIISISYKLYGIPLIQALRNSPPITNRKYLKFCPSPRFRVATTFPSPQRGEGGGEGAHIKMLEENSQIFRVSIYASFGTSP